MSSPAAIRCEGIGKRFLNDYADPYHGLRMKLSALTPWSRQPAAPAVSWALRDVSFEVPGGCVFGVLGGNGSGKSVLLKILARVTKPTTGRSVVHGSIGSILHLGAMLVPELTGRENIYQLGTILRLRRSVVQSRFDEIVAFSGIEAHLDGLVRTYSAGMQLRLAFAVFAYLESDVLLIDEALSVADQEFRGRCMQRIREMALQGRTVVIVSHELETISANCDQVAVLNRGRLIAFGNAHAVVDEYRRAQPGGESRAGD